jgi:methionine biosynthesis protein MetW
VPAVSKYTQHSDTRPVDLTDQSSAWAKVAAYVPSGSTVLDVGCASGYLGEALIGAKAARVWGIEIDPEDAARARGRGLVEVWEGDLELFDWGRLDGLQFDVVIFADVLEHLKRPLPVLERAAGALAPGGRVVASIPNIAHASIRVELMEGGFVYEPLGLLDDTHLRYFTKPTIVDMFQRAGLAVRTLDATVYDLPEDLLLSRLERLGLHTDERFAELLESPEARTYQYIVVAERAADPAALEVVPLPPKLVMPHAQLVNEAADLRRAVDELRAEKAEQQHEIAAQQDEIERLRGAVKDRDRLLDEIWRSRSWRLAQRMSRAYRLVRRGSRDTRPRLS